MDTVLVGDTAFFYLDHPVLLADGDYLLHAKVEYQALRGDETIQTTSLSNIALEVANGQPRPSGNTENQQPPAPVTVIGSAGLQEDRAQRAIVIYATMAAIALAVLAAFAWPRTRKQPTPRSVLTDATTGRASAALSGTDQRPDDQHKDLVETDQEFPVCAEAVTESRNSAWVSPLHHWALELLPIHPPRNRLRLRR